MAPLPPLPRHRIIAAWNYVGPRGYVRIGAGVLRARPRSWAASLQRDCRRCSRASAPLRRGPPGYRLVFAPCEAPWVFRACYVWALSRESLVICRPCVSLASVSELTALRYQSGLCIGFPPGEIHRFTPGDGFDADCGAGLPSIPLSGVSRVGELCAPGPQVECAGRSLRGGRGCALPEP